MRRILGTVAVAFTLLVMGTVPAQAESPSPAVSSSITDRNDKIDDSRMELLVKQVQDETDYELYVYVTDSLSGMSGAQWAVETANKSGLNSSNAVLFVIATEDRKYGSAYPTGSSLSSKISTVESAAIPLMKSADWNGAVEAYGNKLIEASHGAIADTAKQSENTDKAVAGFFGVLTFIIGLLVGLGILVFIVIFGRRFAINFIDYRKGVKETLAEISKFNSTLPGIVTKVDSDLNAVNERISFASAMHGENVMDFAVKNAKAASTSLQTAITYMGEAASFKDRDAIRKGLKYASNALHTAKAEVARAQKVLDDLTAQQEGVAKKATELKNIASSLSAFVVSQSSTVERLNKSFDADYLRKLNKALIVMKEVSVELDAKVSTIAPEADFQKAREAVSEGSVIARKADKIQIAFAKEIIAVNEMDKFRDETVVNSMNVMRSNEKVNGHARISEDYAKAVTAVEKARTVNTVSGNPRKELDEALAPFNDYLFAVNNLKADEKAVDAAKKGLVSLLAQTWGQVDSLVKDVRSYGVKVTDAEMESLSSAKKLTDIPFKILRARVTDVGRDDVRAIAAVGTEIEKAIADVTAKTAPAAKKVAVVEAQMAEIRRKEQVAKARAEQERKRKQDEEEEARRKKRRQEEEESRRRRSSSSSYSSSYSSYGGSSSSSSSFSGSGGSFGDSGSGGSF